MPVYYKQVGPDEAENIHAILRLCGLDMQERLGLRHWVPPYPLEALRCSTQERQVYAVFLEDRMVATFTVGTVIPLYYRKIPAIWQLWSVFTPKALYVNRLAVLPSFQGQGIGRWCMQCIESLALTQGYDVIRLDTYGKHLGLLTFYTKLGYRPQGHFFFTMQQHGKTEVICFEKARADWIAQ